MPFKDDVEDFFLQKALEDPDHWEELAEQYPVNEEDALPARKRTGKTDVPKEKRRKFNDEEWRDVQRNKKKYYDEFREDLKYAKELADEGM